jgi:uroporphyrinogen-III synthase
MRRLFVFRPQPAADQTVERALSMGVDAVALPLFELEPVKWTAPDCRDFDGILLTSANAVNMAGAEMERLRGLPVHAVGEATALAAEVAGFGVAARGDGGVDDLLKSIEPDTRLLHLCGEDRRTPQAPSQAIRRVTVYRAKPLPNVAGLEQLQGQVAVLHSPRAARRLAELVDAAERANVILAAISKAAAEAAGAGWEGIRVASTPTDAALLALAARLCET